MDGSRSDGMLRVQRRGTGRQRKIVDLERGGCSSVLWSEQGLFAGTTEGAVCELETTRARERAVLAEHEDWVEGLVLVDDTLISLDTGGELRRVTLPMPK